MLRTAALLLVWLLMTPAYAAEPAASPASEAQRLVFLLEYIGTDYDMAVRDGQVVDQMEYGEMLRFTKELIEGYGARREKPDASVVDGLNELQSLIEQHAAGDKVLSKSRQLLPTLTRSLGGTVQPKAVPNIAGGRRRFASDCAPCHGPTGNGDGRSANDMDPPPTAFRGDTLEQLSPRQAFNALTFGIDGTAMPSFSDAYTEAQRWDLAFFLMTLRVEFEPERPPENTELSLEELAAHSNVELLNRLRERRPEAGPGEVDWLRANLAAAAGATTMPAGAGAADGLAAALQLQNAFGRVAERLRPRVVGVTGYVRDPEWSPEKLEVERGDAWMLANADAVRYPGFRPLRCGSGLLMDDGYVISSNHIVRDDDDEVVQMVDVELPNQFHIASGVVGSEPTLDLAILRFVSPATDDEVAPLDFGDSDRLEVGNWVIALGDPPGVQKVFAVGVVSSAAERQCYQEQRSATLVQSSLVVPAGGLGGPVVDIFGHVVGISIGQPIASAPTATGQPLAAHTLPINLVLNLFEALKASQSHRSPWLGISVLELPLARGRLGPAAQDKVFPLTGVYIDDVFDPSPASRAGVRPGDFLVGLGGHKLLSVADFQTWLYVLGIGTQAELEIMRDGHVTKLVAPIEVRPETAMMR